MLDSKEWFKDYLADAVARIKARAAKSGRELPVCANGWLLFEEDMTDLALIFYGPGDRVKVATRAINEAVVALEDPLLIGLKVALQPSDQEDRFVLVLTYPDLEV